MSKKKTEAEAGGHFPYRIVTEWSEEDQLFVARVPAFSHVAAHGDTAEEATREAEVAATLALEGFADDGVKPPPPDAKSDYSGNIRLRIPTSLHARLDRQAAAEGVSLNTLMATLLSAGVAAQEIVESVALRVVEITEDVAEKVAKPPIQPVRGGRGFKGSKA